MSETQLKFDLGMMTHTGMVRSHNEDSIRIRIHTTPNSASAGYLFIVADGVGGESYGEVASKITVDRTEALYYHFMEQNPQSTAPQALETVLAQVNRAVYEEAVDRMAEGHMASTVVAAVLRGDQLTIAWAGDSRAYIVVPGQGISQITLDHTHVEDQVRQGLLTREEADAHPKRNVLSRSIGGHYDVEVDLMQGQVSHGNVLVMCSDGLTRHVSDKEIADHVLSASTSRLAAENLVHLANERGGRDNISAIVVYFGDRDIVDTDEDTVIPPIFVPMARTPKAGDAHESPPEPPAQPGSEHPTSPAVTPPEMQTARLPRKTDNVPLKFGEKPPWWKNGLYLSVGGVGALVLMAVMFVLAMGLGGGDGVNNTLPRENLVRDTIEVPAVSEEAPGKTPTVKVADDPTATPTDTPLPPTPTDTPAPTDTPQPPVDTDNDGIPDVDDRCPERLGPIENAGCPPEPPVDTDHDGIPDVDDRCPERPGPIENDGCPPQPPADTDNDGIPDVDDWCPERPGPIENDGCPPEGGTETIPFWKKGTVLYIQSPTGFSEGAGMSPNLPDELRQGDIVRIKDGSWYLSKGERWWLAEVVNAPNVRHGSGWLPESVLGVEPPVQDGSHP